MNSKKENIKEGVCLHTIKTNKFKTNLFSVMLTTPITKENATKNALISLILRRGNAKLKSQDEISKELENMYGAEFDCGIDKIGDNQVIKFYIESLNDEYLPKNQSSEEENNSSELNNFQKSIDLILNIVFNPLIEKNKFKQEYFEGEKEKLKQIIEGKKDNKGLYAFNRCIEEMYKDKPFGIYKFGYIEKLENITNEELYKYYLELIGKCKIDLFISGDNINDSNEIIQKNENIQKLNERKPQYEKAAVGKDVSASSQENIIEEKLDITQGKLVIGMDICEDNNIENIQNIALMYNSILGGTANSKLFQNVREKASLAYTANSNYVRQKNSIFIRAGIEIENYEKALEIIKQQIEDMKQGKFTDEEIENTKQYVISTIRGIPEEQDTELTYYFGQELAGTNNSIEKYIENVQAVTKEQIVDLANKIRVNTIYFLRN